MATDSKKYYWLKLKEDFFYKSKRIKKLRNMAGGDTYVIIYLKIQLAAMKNNGFLEFTGLESDFAEELALEIDERPDNVRMALTYLLGVNLIETSDDINFFVPYAVENTGKETSSAQRVRDCRARKKEQVLLSDGITETPLLQCNTNALHCNTEIEIEKEIEIEIEKEIEIEIEKEKYNTCVSDKKKYGADFERFWKAYPRKIDKGNAYKKYMARVNDGFSPNELLKAAENYEAEVLKNRTDPKYIKHPKTFLSDALPFRDYIPTEVVYEDDDGNPFAEFMR